MKALKYLDHYGSVDILEKLNYYLNIYIAPLKQDNL